MHPVQKKPQPHCADEQKRDIREHIEGEGYLKERPLVRKGVVLQILGEGRHDRERSQCEHPKNDYEETAPARRLNQGCYHAPHLRAPGASHSMTTPAGGKTPPLPPKESGPDSKEDLWQQRVRVNTRPQGDRK